MQVSDNFKIIPLDYVRTFRILINKVLFYKTANQDQAEQELIIRGWINWQKMRVLWLLKFETLAAILIFYCPDFRKHFSKLSMVYINLQNTIFVEKNYSFPNPIFPELRKYLWVFLFLTHYSYLHKFVRICSHYKIQLELFEILPRFVWDIIFENVGRMNL